MGGKDAKSNFLRTFPSSRLSYVTLHRTISLLIEKVDKSHQKMIFLTNFSQVYLTRHFRLTNRLRLELDGANSYRKCNEEQLLLETLFAKMHIERDIRKNKSVNSFLSLIHI